MPATETNHKPETRHDAVRKNTKAPQYNIQKDRRKNGTRLKTWNEAISEKCITFYTGRSQRRGRYAPSQALAEGARGRFPSTPTTLHRNVPASAYLARNRTGDPRWKTEINEALRKRRTREERPKNECGLYVRTK